MMTQQAILKKIVLAAMVFSIASMEAGNGTPRGRSAARGGKGGTRRFKPSNLPSRGSGNQSNQPSPAASTPPQQAPAVSTPAVVPDVTSTQDFPSAGATVEQGGRQAVSPTPVAISAPVVSLPELVVPAPVPQLTFGSISHDELVVINQEPAAQSTILPVSDTPQISAAEGETAHAVLVHFPSEKRIAFDLTQSVESIEADQTKVASATVAPIVVPDITMPVSAVAATPAPENVAPLTNAAVEIAPAASVSEQPAPLISAPVEPTTPVPAPEVAQPTVKNTESPAVTVETLAATSATVFVAVEQLPSDTPVLTPEIAPAAFVTPVALVSADSNSVSGLPENSSVTVAVAAFKAPVQVTPVEVQKTEDLGAGVMPLFNNQNSETPASLPASVPVMVEQSSAVSSAASAVSVNSTPAIEVPASDSGAPTSSAVSTTPEIAGQLAGVEAAQPATVVAPAKSDKATSDVLAGGVAGSQTVPTKPAQNAAKTQTLNSQGQGFFPGLSPRTYAIFASLVVGVPVLIKYGLTPVYRWVFPPEEQEEEKISKKSLITSDFGNQS